MENSIDEPGGTRSRGVVLQIGVTELFEQTSVRGRSLSSCGGVLPGMKRTFLYACRDITRDMYIVQELEVSDLMRTRIKTGLGSGDAKVLINFKK